MAPKHIKTLTRKISLFTLIGASAALAYTIIASALVTNQILNPLLAGVVTYCTIIPLAYFAQHRLTFRSDARHKHAFPKYLSIQIFGLIFSSLTIKVLENTQIPVLGIFALAIGTTSAVSYIMNDRWSFKK